MVRYASECRFIRIGLASLIVGALTAFGQQSAVAGDSSAAPPSDVVAVQTVRFAPRYSGYGQVEPIHDITVGSQVQGTLEGLNIVAGDRVTAGQVIARMAGAIQESAIKQAKSAVALAHTQLALAEQLKKGIDEYPNGLATRAQQQKAAAAVLQANSNLAAANVKLTQLQSASTVRAPVGGVVVSVSAATGELVNVGAALIQIQPDGKLWLKVDYYGEDVAALHRGMKGNFQPADGNGAIGVELFRIVPPQQPDGAVVVTCMIANTASNSKWRSGEAGTLDLLGSKRSAVLVPTASLIMDQGVWWVVVHDAKGEHLQPVTLGPSEGENTLITSGIKPGQQVVVHDAYLRYHHAFATRCTPPD